MDEIYNDKCWSKRQLWKQPKCERNKKKIHKGLRKLRGTFQVTSRGEQQLHYEIPRKLHKYYSTTHRELYGRKYPIHWNLSWVPCIVTFLASFSFAQVMVD